MKKNMGVLDKLMRIALAMVFVVMYATDVVSGTLGYILLALAAVFVLTSAISFCPLYILFGINTSSQKDKTSSSK